MLTTVLSAHDLVIGYRSGRASTAIHQGLSFTLYGGELTCLLGANGCGKSTLLRTLAASQPALGGEISLMGKPMNRYTGRELSRTIGIVLTDKTQAGGLTVYELVALGRQPHTGFFGRLEEHDHRRIEAALQSVGIAHKAAAYVASLSDGERQKVFIAKALVQECPLILLDEPTAFLDVVSRIEIMNLLRRLAAEENRAILLSTHDVEQALTLADRLWLLSPTKGLQCGNTEDMVLSGRMNDLFERGNLNFDPRTGTYHPRVQGARSIRVEAIDDLLLHCSIAALQRMGYRCLPADDVVSEDTPRLRVDSPTALHLNRDGVAQTYDSFEALAVALR